MGQFGDYVGGSLNPMFSFLSLIALLYTIRLQKAELKTSREELELTRDELTKTAEAAQKQAAHFEAEAKPIDLYRIIEKLATRLEVKYKVDEVIKVYGNTKPYVSISFAIDFVDHNPDAKLNLVADCRRDIINEIFNDMESLMIYLNQYNIAYKSIESPLPDFYKKEFIKLSKFVIFYLKKKPYLYSDDYRIRGTDKDLEPKETEVLPESVTLNHKNASIRMI